MSAFATACIKPAVIIQFLKRNGRRIGVTGSTPAMFKVATVVLAPGKYVYVEHDGRLVAAIETISPRTGSAIRRATATNRCARIYPEWSSSSAGRSPAETTWLFFAESIGLVLFISISRISHAHLAVSLIAWVSDRRSAKAYYRNYGNGPCKRVTASVLPLTISNRSDVPIDLETTYMKAAADAYCARRCPASLSAHCAPRSSPSSPESSC